MNAVLLAVLVMLILAVCRVHVVLALFIGALVGGLSAGMGLDATMVAFQEGLSGGAKIALSYAMLGAFAMAVASSGLPKLLADWLIAKIGAEDEGARSKAEAWTKWGMVAGILAMAIMSQNLIPVHIAFIPLIIPPLLPVFNRLNIDRRMIASVMTFPALGMLLGLAIAVFFSYRKPRHYEDLPIAESSRVESQSGEPVSKYRVIVALVAIVVTFVVQIVMNSMETDADPLLIGALTGLAIFMLTGAVRWREADDVFTAGMKMMALIGFIMISAQGFASVMSESGQVEPLVTATADLFAGNKPAAAFAMLVVGLVVTMGIGSSFSTLPIISIIYVPLCLSLGFSPMATVAIIGTAGALGDAGSPASDSTLGPTMGLNADGQHDHIRDSVIPTFLHFNLPLLAAGWVAALVL